MGIKILVLSGIISLGFITTDLSDENYAFAASKASIPQENVHGDNSVTNKRDRRPEELTAEQQGGKKSDVELTRLIRKGLVAHDELSTNAKNLKIITRDGVVTLKGPVATRDEMKKVEEIARLEAGDHNVINEIQVTSRE